MNHRSYIISEGFPFIIPLGLVTVIAFVAGFTWIAVLLLLLTLFVIWFFRNPERTMPENPLQIISPADGKVIGIDEVASEEHPDRTLMKISIFMNVFNVHVNRIPFSGEVLSIQLQAREIPVCQS